VICGPCDDGGGCGPGTTRIGNWCVEDAIRSSKNFVNAGVDCHEVERTICPVEALMLCDALSDAVDLSSASCTLTTDSNVLRLWTSTYSASFGDSVFQGIVTYGEDNKAFKASINELYPFYCCESAK